MGEKVSRALRRRRLALAACAVWILGYEAGPNLHIGLHVHLAAHSHGHEHTDLSRHSPAAHAREHHAREHHAREHHAREHHAREHHAREHHAHEHFRGRAAGNHHAAPQPGTAHVAPFTPDPLEHGEHSLAHRAMSWLAPVPVATQPLPVTLQRIPYDVSSDESPRSRRPTSASARGPPARIGWRARV